MRLLLHSLFASVLLGSALPGAELSLDTAVAQALARNQALAAKGPFEVEKARARAEQAGLPRNPEVEVGGRGDLLFGNEGERSFSVGVSQSFPRRNRLRLARDAANLTVAEQEQLARDDQRLLIGEVQRQYVELLGLSAQHAARQRLIETNQRLAGLVQQRFQAGEVPQTDVAPLRLEGAKLAQEQQLLLVEKAAREIDLKLALGLPATEPLVLTTALDEALARLQPAANGGPGMNSRPDYLAAQSRIEQANANVRLARAEAYEDITVSADLERERTEGSAGGFRNDNFLGVKVTIPLPIRNKNQGRIAEEQAAQRQSTAELGALGQRISSEIARAQTMVQNIAPLIGRYRDELVPMAETNLQAIQRAYEQGQVSITQVVQAQLQRSELELDYQDYLTRMAESLIDLQTAAGTHPLLRTSASTNPSAP